MWGSKSREALRAGLIEFTEQRIRGRLPPSRFEPIALRGSLVVRLGPNEGRDTGAGAALPPSTF